MLADGEISAPELLEIYLERIARLDSQLRSYRVVLTDKARDEAYAAQDRLDAGERLPLLGVPIAIKDDVDIAGEVTTCGSAGHRPAGTADAAVVRRLRAAGAVIIGKTAVPELMILSLHRVAGVRGHPKSVEPQAHSGWQQRRQRRRGGRRAGVVGAGLRRRRLDRIPSTWCGLFGLKPATRSHLARAARQRVVRAERQRPDCAFGGGRGAVARCDQHGARSRRRVRGRRHPIAGQAANCLEHQGPNHAGARSAGERAGRRRGRRRCCCANWATSSSSATPLPAALDLRQLLAALPARHQR